MRYESYVLRACVLTLLTACGGSHQSDSREDSGPADAGEIAPDASIPMDGGLVDAGAPDAGDVDAGAPSSIGPTQRDFSGYREWMSFDGGTTPADGLTVTGQRTLYLNHAPPHGSASFPEGTIIVKETEGAQTFAMYKRGGTYNAQGATGWEWFELAIDPGGSVLILWEGTAPPRGMTYSALLSCNACHAQAKANDFVAGDAIQLASF